MGIHDVHQGFDPQPASANEGESAPSHPYVPGENTVLIVDDEPSARESLEALLFKEGYNLAFAKNGYEGLDKAAKLLPDIVLLDVMMPGIGGFEVCQNMRNNPVLREVPIIMITALDDREFRLKGIESGADDFISKPFDSVELRTRIRSILRLNRYRRLLQERTQRQKAEVEIHRLYGELQQYTNHLEDIVAQRTAELQSERDRTHAILEAAGEAVIVTDLDGVIDYANPAAQALTGYDDTALPGLHWNALSNDGSLTDPDGEIQQALRTGDMWRSEMLCVRKNGDLVNTALTVAPLIATLGPSTSDVNEKRPIIGLVTVQRDITLFKEAERIKDQFVSNVSHELRTPLSVITLIVGNLENMYSRLDNEQRLKMVKEIRTETRVLAELIDGVLELSRIDSRHKLTNPQKINIVDLAYTEAASLLPLADNKAQTLKLEGVAQLNVWGDAVELRQVIRNLLNNAIKYTPTQESVTCECRVIHADGAVMEGWPGCERLAPGQWAGVRVTDTGIGIHAENIPHLFGRFYRVESQRNVPGTGLGLAIAKEIVELHNGRIALSSQLDVGSTFAFYLPLMDEDASENPPAFK